MAKGKYEEWLRPDKLLLIEGWARDGLSEEQIAHNMGISRSTLKEWKKKYPAISATVKKNKEVADREIENALFKSAMGFISDEPEQTWVRKFNPKTNEYEMVLVEEKRKYIPPSQVAQIFWLKNRKPEVWRDKQEIVDTDALDKLDAILGELKNAADSQTE